LEDEHFSTYVQAIKDAALVLCINESENQVVERVVEGLTPTQHAPFIFQTPPSSFRQLERLAIVDRNIAYADRSRTDTASEVTIAVVGSSIESGKPGGSGNKISQEPRQRKAVVCFYCRGLGHHTPYIIRHTLYIITIHHT
jgi:hypothetical protein